MTSDPPSLPRPVESDRSALDQIRGFVDGWVAGRSGRTIASGVIAFVVVLVVGLVVVRATLAEPPPPIETVLPTVGPADADAGPAVAAAAPTPTPEIVVVHVAGAVARPGVVQLAAGARVGDAVAVAGGALAEADLDRVNLAATALDGSQIVVPRIGEAVPAPVAPVAGTQNPSGEPGAGPIDINTADLAALETLPGVGPATAAAIIAHREEHGPFSSVSSLDDVPGIGETRLEALRDLVTVG